MSARSDGDENEPLSSNLMASLRLMDKLYEKLIILSYNNEVAQLYRCNAVNRYYFAVKSNPGEQFYTFSCLCAWLIKKKLNLSTEHDLNPQEYGDPNLIINIILQAVAKINPSTFIPANRLKQGYGNEVITVLDVLVNEAMKKIKFTKHFQVKELNQADNELNDSNMNDDKNNDHLDDEDDELELEMINDEQYLMIDENEDNMNDYSQFRPDFINDFEIKNSGLKSILNSNTTAQNWEFELERVIPQLKTIIRPMDQKLDWRLHVNNAHKNKDQINEQLKMTDESLSRLSNEIRRTLSKCEAREKHLQIQLEPLINEFSALKSELNGFEVNYQAINGGVIEKSAKLAEVSEQIELIKEEMERKGEQVSDGSVLLTLRKTLASLKQEIHALDIRSGVAIKTLIQFKANDEATLTATMSRNEGLAANTDGLNKLRF